MNYPPDYRKRRQEMNPQSVIQLIVMVRKLIKERMGGTGLVARITELNLRSSA